MTFVTHFKSIRVRAIVVGVLVLCVYRHFSQTPNQLVSFSTLHRRLAITCDDDGTSCSDAVGLVGEWVYADPTARSFSAPVCCSPVGECFNRQKSRSIMFTDLSNTWRQEVGRVCYCDNFVDKYVWQSPNLPSYFDPIETCRLLGTRTVLFVGDSTMSQTLSTLKNSLVPGGCQSQVGFAQSDTLVKQNFGARNRGETWRKQVETYQPDIAFVTLGAHVYMSSTSYIDLVDEILSEMKEFQKIHPNITFAWKTQQPGGCTKDILHPKDPTLVHFSEDHPEYKYNWDQFYERDLLLLRRLQTIGMPYLDMRMLYSRSDAHVSSQEATPHDCLHLCSPGPLDVVGLLFQQFLLDME